MDPANSPAPLPTLTESQRKSAHAQTVKTGRGWILAVAVLQLAAALLFLGVALADTQPRFSAAFLNLGVVMGVLGLIYLGLWLWAKRSPFAAALVALVFYLSLLALEAVINPATLIDGLIIKILIVVGLSQAVRSSYALKKAADEAAA